MPAKAMTSELRPAMEVWRDASDAATLGSVKYKPAADQAAAAVIEADREAVRAEQAAEIERLRERLEIDPAHSIDGIYARDETIRGLDTEILKLKARDIGWSMQFEEQAEELAKYKALAETLAGALEPFAEEWDEREFLAQRHWSFYREASKAIAEYKEATNV